MRAFIAKHRLLSIVTGLSVFASLISGCATLGPRAIKTGRIQYNQAITHTEGQQLLLNIVRSRYGEIATSLAVSGIAANAKMHTAAGLNIGFGADSGYSGNLVPFSSNVFYEENPTITYAPVQGMKAIQQLTSPIPLDIVVPLANMMMYQSPVMSMVIKSINEFENPAYLHTTESKPDDRYSRTIDIMTGLARAGRLFWSKIVEAGESSEDARLAIVIRGYAPDYSEAVSELLGLLHVPKPRKKSADVVIKTVLSFEKPGRSSLGIMTRSVTDLLELLAAAVDVPEEDQLSGAAIQFPQPGLPGRDLKIHRSEKRPRDASIAVKHRHFWFYVDDSDQSTKQAVRLLQLLYSAMTGEEAAKSHVAPALTIPLSQ